MSGQAARFGMLPQRASRSVRPLTDARKAFAYREPTDGFHSTAMLIKKETTMRLDIYRRAEQDGKFSYLVVPETKNIPEEATNTDWEVEARAVEVDDNAADLPDYQIHNVSGQLAEKGYAVTSTNH
jgi:hypothetical protein